jgi:molecular chaperone DnaK
MKAEAEANAEADAKAKEQADLVNKADSMIFQTERQLKEYGDKIPAEKKQPIEDALAELKKEFEAKNLENLQPAMDKLNDVFQAASQDMYNAAQQDGAGAEGAAGGATGDTSDSGDEVTDVDFEEVDEK